MPKAQILIVEDSKIITLELEDRLENLGYIVCGAVDSGRDAVEQAMALQPDLVLMDIRLKGTMDGIEAAAEIQAHHDVPVVYLTAYADEDTLQRAKITEPYGYIVKPFEERELYTAIEIALYKHRMEQRLKESERWLNTTLRSIGDAVVATDVNGWVSFMNAAAEGLTGWRQNEIHGKRAADILQVVREESRAVAVHPVQQALQAGQPYSLDRHILWTRDGRDIPIDGSTALIQDERGQVKGAVLVFRDVSRRKQDEQEREKLQADLFQAQKMEAVGILAGGVAHDFNNLMTTIVGYSSLLLSEPNARELLQEGLEYIRNAGERGASLTQQLLALSRKQVPESQVLALNDIVIDMEEMLQRLVGEDINVIIGLGTESGCIRADPVQMEQVIMNLVVNAQEAMPEGGRVTVKTETVTLDETQMGGSPDAYPGTFVRLSVIDTGRGIESEIVEQIFEPFFSTKKKGTGLGLSIVNSISRQYNGWVQVESQPGQGAIFQVYLPACFEDLEDKDERARDWRQLRGNGERVLLVEDDKSVRAAIAEMLRTGGYLVVEAPTTHEALATFEREKGRFDLVLSDVVLPDRDGLYLAEELLAQNPDLPLLLTSGYTDQRSQWSLIRERGYAFLRKPFDLSELLSAIQEVIAGDGQTR